jgi:hypothetical protein
MGESYEPDVLPSIGGSNGGSMKGDAAALVAQGATLMRIENESMLAVAIQRPRDPEKVLKAAIKELQIVPEEARKAYYSIPYKERQPDGSQKMVNVEGPSVKASNALARLWGNCSVTSRSLQEDATGCDLAGIFIDFETNFRMERPFRATKVKKSRRGGTYTLDQQKWIAELQAAASKAQRNATLNGLPAWLIAQYMKQARFLAAGDPNSKADPKKVASVLKAFERFKVTQEMLERYVNAKVETWMGDHLATLIGLGNAIADEQLTVAEAFDLDDSDQQPAGPATATNGVTTESVLGGSATGVNGANPGGPAAATSTTAPASAQPSREPGEDDGPAPTQSATQQQQPAKPKSGQRRLDE